jgi:cytochrome P450
VPWPQGSTLAREIAKGEQALLVDLTADLAGQEEGSRPDAVEAQFGVSLLDGLHSLSSEIASVVHALLSSERHHAAVRADSSLAPQAFYEGARLHPAVTLTQRHALQDFEYAGVVIPQGTAVTMAWLFGNRDPEVFDGPNDYKFDRPNRRQTTFGGGFYICPGRNVVKLLCETVITALTAPSVEIVATGDANWVSGSGLHEIERMPVSIRRH